MDEKYKEWEEQQKQIDAELAHIDISGAPPEEEPARQMYFIKKVRQIVLKRSREIGRPLFSHLVTFGCEMNTEYKKARTR